MVRYRVGRSDMSAVDFFSELCEELLQKRRVLGLPLYQTKDDSAPVDPSAGRKLLDQNTFSKSHLHVDEELFNGVLDQIHKTTRTHMKLFFRECLARYLKYKVGRFSSCQKQSILRCCRAGYSSRSIGSAVHWRAWYTNDP